MRGLRSAISVAAVLISACAPAPLPTDLVIRDVMVHSGEPERPYRATVAVTDGVFAAIDREDRLRFEARQSIDGSDLHLMPGLWDMHVHLATDETGRIDVTAFPQHGVTSVRDAGGLPEEIAAIRARVTSGEIVGPTIYSVGPTLNGEQFGPHQRPLRTEEEVKAAVDELAANGVVMIKIHRAFKPELLPVVLEAAHTHGLDLTGHIPLGVSPLEACELGMDGVEHVGSFLEAHMSVAAEEEIESAAAIAYLESDDARPLYDCLVKRRVAVTPTLAAYPAIARHRAGDGPMPADYLEFMEGVQRIVLRLHEAGVPLLAGTDTAYSVLNVAPGTSLLDELELLQDAGIPARDVIVMATSTPAHTLGVEARTGSIAVGKAADFLLLEDDPETDIANVRRMRAVFQAGQRIASGR